MKLTMSAFCCGETLQARTTSTLSEAYKNKSSNSLLVANTVKVSPATTTACFFPWLIGLKIFSLT